MTRGSVGAGAADEDAPMYRHYFVDEAGDTTLFGRHGKVLLGGGLVSRFFMVGRLEVDDVPALEADMRALRTRLLADPLLRGIPSMQASAGKTALFFHAKDDVPEVRHAVFSLLMQHGLRFSAVVRDKQVLLDEVHKRSALDPRYRYKADGHDLYDALIAKLFSQLGSFASQRHISFAVRGSKPRTAVLKNVLDGIDQGFINDFGFAPHAKTVAQSSWPPQHAGLQACDYFLWALQRFYERGEDRYLRALWPQCSRVLDMDVPAPPKRGRARTTAKEFNEKHPLTLESRAGVGEKVSRDIG